MNTTTQIYDQFIVTKLQLFFAENETQREKKSFWATDAEKPVFDLYHQWIGTPATNPIDAEKLVMFQSAKMTELALVAQLQALGILQKPKQTFWDRLLGKEDKQFRVEMVREGVPVTGYIDGLFVDGTPLEVKTFYGEYQAKELKAGKPKTAYLKQLAVYMDFLNVDKGKLIYMDRGTGEMYEFTLVREGNNFKCLTIEFDITDTYKRWARLYKNNILPMIEPKSEYVYKYPIEQIKTASKATISAARTNKAVHGDWQIKYSPYKDLLIEREGCGLGYSDEELRQIKELTKGYSSKY